MHLDRGIVRTYRWSDGISTRQDNHNNLNCQSSDTKDALRDSIIGPIKDPINPTSLSSNFADFFPEVESPLNPRV